LEYFEMSISLMASGALALINWNKLKTPILILF
jgi:hypothetical protein